MQRYRTVHLEQIEHPRVERSNLKKRSPEEVAISVEEREAKRGVAR